MMMRSAMLMLMAAGMLGDEAPKPVPPLLPAPYIRNPLYWPKPVMDTVPPAIPALRRGAVLILSKTNGFRDDDQIAAAAPIIATLAREQGRDTFVTENAAVMNKRDLTRFSTVVLNSTSGTIFDEHQRTAFRAWIEHGGGVVMLHGAGGDHDYDWMWYRDTLLGAAFIGHTAAPDQFQTGKIHIIDHTNPATQHLPATWTRTEEWYAFDRVPGGHDTHILATLDEGTYRPAREQRMGAVHPLIWTRCIGHGRVIFSALGHKAETYDEPLHQTLISGAIRWASRAQGKGC